MPILIKEKTNVKTLKLSSEESRARSLTIKGKTPSLAISPIEVFFDLILTLHIGAALGYIFGKITGCLYIKYFKPINLNLNELIRFLALPYSFAIHGAIAGAVVGAIIITALAIRNTHKMTVKKEVAVCNK